jgi:two-component system, OmpR family, phosphate regulon sensor histidine kinase PhoR
MARALRTHHKLFLSYALIVVGVVAILVVGVDAALRQPLIERAGIDLHRELALGKELYDTGPVQDPHTMVRRISGLVGHRVTLIAPDGTVLGDSDVPPSLVPDLENHSARPEVAQAMAARSGTDVRRSVSVAQDLVYAAVRTDRGEILRFAVDVAQIDQAIARVRTQILRVGALALLLALAFSLAFSHVVTRRLRTMRQVALDMAGGDLDARVRSRHDDELGALGTTLDRLAEELKRRLGQLESERTEMRTLIDSMAEGVLAVGPDGAVRRSNPAARRMFDLPSDMTGAQPEAVTRRKPFLDLVRRALAGEAVPATELVVGESYLLATAQPLPQGGAVLVFLDTTAIRRLEEVRRDFVANASHELKTPLTAIRGYSETLLDDDLPADLRRSFTRTLHDNAERLHRILDDLLDLSRIESGGWTPEPEPLDLDHAARDAWLPLQDQAHDRRVSLRLRLDPGAERLSADPAAVRQILANLLSNAVRYSPDGGTIEIAASPSADAPGLVRIQVRDQGPGIPAEHLGRIFERFYRVDPARSRAEGGTGLGLAIVRHLVERHGGRVTARSEPGHGTTIDLTLPAAPPPHHP